MEGETTSLVPQGKTDTPVGDEGFRVAETLYNPFGEVMDFDGNVVTVEKILP